MLIIQDYIDSPESSKRLARKYGNPLYEGSEENHQYGIG